MLLDIVHQNLKTEGFFRDPRQVHFLLAYSGGMDSTALLHLMAQLAQKENIRLTAAYYDHGWRGEFPEELGLLHQNCAQLRIPLVLIQPDRTLPKTEAAARDVRYKQLTQLAQDMGAHAVLTAHHADDQIETLLFNLFRGTGLDGLTGIQKQLTLVQRTVPVVRPMLDIFKDGIRMYVESKNLSYFEDPSNQNTQFSRNALRQELIPQLITRFPQMKHALLRLTDIVEGESSILEDKVQDVWQQVYEPISKASHLSANTFTQGTLKLNSFNLLMRPYQRRILRKYLQTHGLEANFELIESTIEFIQGKPRKKRIDTALKSMEFPVRPVAGSPSSPDSLVSPSSQIFLSIFKNTIALIARAKADDTPLQEEVPVPLPGVVYMSSLDISLSVLPHRPKARNHRPSRYPRKPEPIVWTKGASHLLEIPVDLSRFSDKPLVFRTRRQGDKIQPFGMPAATRLKRFLINRGVPRFERDRMPMLVCGDEVLWIPTIGLSEQLRVKGQPTHVLKLDYEYVEPPESFDEPILPPLSDDDEDEEDTAAEALEENPKQDLIEATELAQQEGEELDYAEPSPSTVFIEHPEDELP